MKIVFLTATGAYNIGDELILSEEVRYIRSRYPEADITIFTYDARSSLVTDMSRLSFVSYFPNHIRTKPLENIGYFFQNISTLLRADMVFIGGGSILFDNEHGISFRRLLLQWFFRICIARIGRAKICFWGIGIDIMKHENRLKISILFSKKDTIFVRDHETYNIIEALELHPTLIPDIVFLHSPPIFSPETTAKKMVWISLRWWFSSENLACIPAIYDFLLNAGYDPIFLAHSFSGDAEQNDILKIRAVMGQKAYKITKSLKKTLSLYPSLYAVCGMRFHAGVLACVHEVPFIPFFYGTKGRELVKTLWLERLAIDIRHLNLALFQEMWHTLESDYPNFQKQMVLTKNTLREHITETLKKL